jgi:hypothetical protein
MIFLKITHLIAINFFRLNSIKNIQAIEYLPKLTYQFTNPLPQVFHYNKSSAHQLT